MLGHPQFTALIRTIKEQGVQSPGKGEIVRVPVNLPSAPSGTLTRAVAVQYLESVMGSVRFP